MARLAGETSLPDSAVPVSKKENSPAPRRVVVKLGTGVLTTGIGRLDTARIAAVCAEIAALRARGTEVIVVSSGAVGLGMGALQLAKRPKDVSKKQACAAIGQSRLMQTWEAGFASHGIVVAQVLLTHEDLRARDRPGRSFVPATAPIIILDTGPFVAAVERADHPPRFSNSAATLVPMRVQDETNTGFCRSLLAGDFTFYRLPTS